MTAIQGSISDSTTAFQTHVWPMVNKAIGGGSIIPVEGVNTTMTNKLDMVSGIDFWQVLGNNEGVRGIASRVQPSGRAWNTFTIRRHLKSGHETEFHKRIRAIFMPEKGLLFPTITIQAYMGVGYSLPVLSIGIIRTKDLYLSLLLNYERWEVKPVAGGNSMMVLPWGDIVKIDDKIMKVITP